MVDSGARLRRPFDKRRPGAHLFQPFYRADASRARATGGFGLGLSLCQAIVQAHGGRIAIESVEGQGMTVTVELPRTI